MTAVLFGILIPFALFVIVLLYALCRSRNIRAGLKIPFANFSFEATDPITNRENTVDTPEPQDSVSAPR
jgi:hypothetical protein